MDTEIHNAQEKGCWKEYTWEQACQFPSFLASKLVDWMWVWKVKEGLDGLVSRFRARMVLRGDMCVPMLQYDQVFAPVVSFDTNRTLFAIAVEVMAEHPGTADVYQADVSMAFPNAELAENVWAKIPVTQASQAPDGKPNVWKIIKNVYGAPQGPKNWYDFFCKVMQGLPKQHKGVEVTRFTSDLCIFKVTKDGDTMWCSLYVDDITTVSTHYRLREWFLDALREHFTLQDAECGPCTWLLGVKVDVNYDKQTISLSQALAIDKLVRSVGINEATEDLPMKPGLKLTRLTEHELSLIHI